MSRRGLHQDHPQTHPFNFLQGPFTPQPRAYHNPYSSATAPRHHFAAPDRQARSDFGPRHQSNMPNLSSLTSSALINALITPSADEHEQHRDSLPLSAPFSDPRVPQARRSHVLENFADEHSDFTDPAYSVGARKQPQLSPTRKTKKQQNKRKGTASSEVDHGYVEQTSLDEYESSQSPRKRRRSTRPKKEPVLFDYAAVDEEDDEPLYLEPKPRKSTTAKKPRKERPGRLIRKKPIGMAVPKTLGEAGPADKMMWEWKNQGKNWEEIRAEWKKITGVEPGGSSLSVRYIKLVENLARNSAAGDIELLRFKKEAEEELLAQLWQRVAEKMLSFSSESEYNPKDLQKRYNMIVRSGYDVEKLLAEDKLKHQAEQNHGTASREVTNYEDDFDMTMDNLNAYDDPVANATAAYIREHGQASMAHHTTFPPFNESGPPMPDNMAVAFQPNNVLQTEVDGHNEREQLYSREFGLEGQHTAATLMSHALLHPTKPTTDHKQLMTCEHDMSLAPSYPLIPYESDSE